MNVFHSNIRYKIVRIVGDGTNDRDVVTVKVPGTSIEKTYLAIELETADDYNARIEAQAQQNWQTRQTPKKPLYPV
jgi:hypothetical protein